MADAYVTGSFIGVNHAFGLPTPDEFVVLFYDDVQTGERFRGEQQGGAEKNWRVQQNAPDRHGL